MARKKLESLTEPMYYVLLALAQGPRHGYEIMQVVFRLTGGRVNVGAGTLYALLSRFEEEGYLLLSDTRERRKYYELTSGGRAALKEEYERLRRQVSDGSEILEGSVPPQWRPAGRGISPPAPGEDGGPGELPGAGPDHARAVGRCAGAVGNLERRGSPGPTVEAP